MVISVKDNKWPKVIFITFYIFIFFLLLRNSFNYLDPDLGWHLKVGEEIAQSQLVPDINNYNYVFTGHWVDHEWLSNFVIYEIYNNFGYLALSVFFAALMVLVLILLNREARRLYPSVAPGFILVLEILGIVASLPHLGVRIQELGILFIVLLLLIINSYSRKKNWRILLFLPPLFYLWASLHASFLLGLGLLAAWVGIKIFVRIIRRFSSFSRLDFSESLSSRHIFLFFVASVLSIGATLLTPYHFKLYSFLKDYQSSFYRSHIQEWLSQFSFPFIYWQLVYLALVVLFLSLYIYYIRRRKILSINLWSLFLLVFFVFLSFQSRRHFPLMFVATFWFMLEIQTLVWSTEPSKKLFPYSVLLPVYLLICSLLVITSQITQINFSNKPFQSFYKDYPRDAVKFLQNHPEYDDARLFNHYAWGGYLIWTWPERQIFIDGRLPQLPLAGHTYLQEYYEFFKKDGQIEDKLKQYDIALVLIPVQDKNVTAKPWEKFLFMISDEELISHNYLRDYLQSANDWQILYTDETAVVYGKKP